MFRYSSASIFISCTAQVQHNSCTACTASIQQNNLYCFLGGLFQCLFVFFFFNRIILYSSNVNITCYKFPCDRHVTSPASQVFIYLPHTLIELISFGYQPQIAKIFKKVKSDFLFSAAPYPLSLERTIIYFSISFTNQVLSRIFLLTNLHIHLNKKLLLYSNTKASSTEMLYTTTYTHRV